jgi:hypothetical protein
MIWRQHWCQGTVGEGINALQELTELVVAGMRMVGVEASHCYSAMGIGPILMLLGGVSELPFTRLL